LDILNIVVKTRKVTKKICVDNGFAFFNLKASPFLSRKFKFKVKKEKKRMVGLHLFLKVRTLAACFHKTKDEKAK
jgi:hypothetical protein